MVAVSGDPFPKSSQLARGERRYRRKVASPKQWQAINAAKLTGCRICGVRKPIEAHHLVPRDRHGDDVADNIVPLCPGCHHEVEAREPQACLRLVMMLSDAEYAYAVEKAGEPVWESVYGITYTR